MLLVGLLRHRKLPVKFLKSASGRLRAFGIQASRILDRSLYIYPELTCDNIFYYRWCFRILKQIYSLLGERYPDGKLSVRQVIRILGEKSLRNSSDELGFLKYLGNILIFKERLIILRQYLEIVQSIRRAYLILYIVEHRFIYYSRKPDLYLEKSFFLVNSR